MSWRNKMTVGALIKQLMKFDIDLEVVLSSDTEGNSHRYANNISLENARETDYDYLEIKSNEDYDELDVDDQDLYEMVVVIS